MLCLLWLKSDTTLLSLKVTNPNFQDIPPDKIRCSDFYSHTDAQIFFENQKNDKYSHLDKDNDGIVCEGL